MREKGLNAQKYHTHNLKSFGDRSRARSANLVACQVQRLQGIVDLRHGTQHARYEQVEEWLPGVKGVKTRSRHAHKGGCTHGFSAKVRRKHAKYLERLGNGSRARTANVIPI